MLNPAYLAHFHLLTEEEKKALKHHYGLFGAEKLSDTAIAELLRAPGVNTAKIKHMVAIATGKLREAHERDTARQRSKAVSRTGVNNSD